MNEVLEYLKEDEREKKSSIPKRRPKKFTPPSGSFSSEVVRFNSHVSLKTWESLSDELRKDYVNHLIDEYGPSVSYTFFADMWRVSVYKAKKYLCGIVLNGRKATDEGTARLYREMKVIPSTPLYAKSRGSRSKKQNNKSNTAMLPSPINNKTLQFQDVEISATMDVSQVVDFIKSLGFTGSVRITVKKE